MSFRLLIFFFFCFIATFVQAANEKLPNVLFIMVDEMRWDAMSCVGEHSVYQTPCLDSLAAEGTRFTQTYTAAAICGPSRYSFFTSRYAHVHGATDNQTPIREQQILLPTLMKRLGYQTAISGKLHFSPPEKDYDFDYFWSYFDEGPKTLETWKEYIARKHGVRTSRPKIDQPFPDDPFVPSNQKRGNSFVDKPEILRAMTAAYRVKIKYVDDSIARLLEGLKKSGLENDTLIVFTSDHGNMLGEHNRWFKGVPYDASTRIPLIIKAPQNSPYTKTFNQGKTVNAIVESIDVMPTLFEMIGKPLPNDPGFQGKSFTKLAAGEDPDWKNTAFSERNILMVRSGKYKLVKDVRIKENPYLLFDIEKDPYEMTNLCGQPDTADIFERLRKQLDDWQHNNPPVPKLLL
jgi:arylsulfatase A-like enzyme